MQTAHTERAHCPKCGIPTVPDHEDLAPDEMLCDACYEHEYLPIENGTARADRILTAYRERDELKAVLDRLLIWWEALPLDDWWDALCGPTKQSGELADIVMAARAALARATKST